MRIIRENVHGIAEFDWNSGTRQELNLSPAQAEDLEAGKLVHTALKGGTDFYLVEEGSKRRRITCPTCRGTGRIEIAGRQERLRVYSEEKSQKGKIA